MSLRSISSASVVGTVAALVALAPLSSARAQEGIVQLEVTSPTRPSETKLIQNNGAPRPIKSGARVKVGQDDTVLLRITRINTLLYKVKVDKEIINDPNADFSAFLELVNGKKAETPAAEDVKNKGAGALAAPGNPRVEKFKASFKEFRRLLLVYVAGKDLLPQIAEAITDTETKPNQAVRVGQQDLNPVLDPETYVKAKTKFLLESARNDVGDPIWMTADITNGNLAKTKSDQLVELEATFKDLTLAKKDIDNNPAGIEGTVLTEIRENFVLADTAMPEARRLLDVFKEIEKVYKAVLKAKFTVEWDDSLELEEGQSGKIKLQIEPVQPSLIQLPSAVKLESHNQVISVTTSGGWRMTASAGVFFLTGLADQTYALETDASGKKIIRQRGSKSNQDSFKQQLGLFVHRQKDVSGGLVTGVGLTLGAYSGLNNTINFGLGGSLFMGQKKRLVTTFGFGTGQTTRLDGVEVGQEFTGDTIPTHTVTRGTFFFALSWNL